MMNNRKTSKKVMMRGFMCDSMAATAVCTMSDPAAGSVIVARRPHRTTLVDDENSRLIKVNAKYSRLDIEPPRRQRSVAAAAAYKRSVFLPSSSTKREDSIIQQLDQKPKPSEMPIIASSSSEQVLQEVVMRVSLHCQGCAGKVKKHLSKMEGVTSFSIDLETKRVIVTGHVSPIGVLESISKVVLCPVLVLSKGNFEASDQKIDHVCWISSSSGTQY